MTTEQFEGSMGTVPDQIGRRELSRPGMTGRNVGWEEGWKGYVQYTRVFRSKLSRRAFVSWMPMALELAGLTGKRRRRGATRWAERGPFITSSHHDSKKRKGILAVG